MKTEKINFEGIFFKRFLSLVAIAICLYCVFPEYTYAGNPYDLGGLASSITSQKSAVKDIVGAICGLIFIAGIVHVIIAFVNHSQNLKNIIMSYVGAFIAFAALWAFL